MVPALQIRREDFIARFWLALYLSGLQFVYINRLNNHGIKIFYLHTKMFSSFRSLCTTPSSWIWAKPSIICFTQWRTSSTVVAFSDLPGVDSSSLKMWFLKFPLHFSMTKMILVLIGLLISRYMPWNCTMWGCFRILTYEQRKEVQLTSVRFWTISTLHTLEYSNPSKFLDIAMKLMPKQVIFTIFSSCS